jgi:hypothetical protein
MRIIDPEAQSTVYRVAWARKDWEASGLAGVTMVRLTEGYTITDDIPKIVALARCPIGTTADDVLILAAEEVQS